MPIYVTNLVSNTIGEYTTTGAVVNASLITGLNAPTAIAVSGVDLFVTNAYGDTIGEYTTSGATVERLSGLGVERSHRHCNLRIGPLCLQ